jgi:hypothetical protein
MRFRVRLRDFDSQSNHTQGWMRKLLAFVVAVMLAAAYAAGRWPERQRRLTLEGEAAVLRDRLADAEGRASLAAQLAAIRNLIDAAAERSFSRAQALATAFFDHVEESLAGEPEPGLREVFQAVLGARDPVIAGLAREEGDVVRRLREVEQRLRAAAGYPPALPAAAAAGDAPP